MGGRGEAHDHDPGPGISETRQWPPPVRFIGVASDLVAGDPPARGDVATLRPEPGAQLSLHGRRALVNPGSVGQPRDGDPRASALILDTSGGRVTWIRTAYDIEATQRAMRAARLPTRGIARLGLGI